ncbi:MAG: hypothetical protein K8S25_06475 [Alphaproteobacteria bacterium]|nr:hypothetical protein [Alphaproteobacteria bacterium]
MSTVLWANFLLNGIVTSDESDKPALHKHATKLDGICLDTSKLSFEAICDSTDVTFNLGDEELPEGMASTNEVMAKSGVWMDGAEAVRMLTAALAHIQEKQTRFGLLKNDYEQVVSELEESITHAKAAASSGGKFNFSIVM